MSQPKIDEGPVAKGEFVMYCIIDACCGNELHGVCTSHESALAVRDEASKATGHEDGELFIFRVPTDKFVPDLTQSHVVTD